MAPLLAHLGVSLVERAVLDALCRALGEPLHRVVRHGALALDLGAIYAELGATPIGELLPGEPLGACDVRHTVGLGDPLTPQTSPRRSESKTGCRRISSRPFVPTVCAISRSS